MTSLAALRSLATGLLASTGVPPAPASRTAELITLADVWGIGSHGLLRLPYYLERLAAGGVNAHAELTVVTDSPATVAYHGHDGLGHWQLWHAAEVAAERATVTGIAAASVASSSHCGCLGIYTLPGLRRGLLSLVFSTGPAVMAAPGTATPLVSTSPLAAGIPCRPRPSIVDLATSSVARGKIAAYAQRDEPIPDGWAVDSTGVPTNDPQTALAGMLAPLGGPKGFAVAFLVEALAGGVAGPTLAVDIPDMFKPEQDPAPQRIGHLVITLDPAVLSVDGHSSDRLATLAANIGRAGGRIPGASRALPWELSDTTEVEISADTLDRLEKFRTASSAS